MAKFILLPILLILWCPLAQAQIYKWVDPKGRVQYSELPPQNQNYEVLSQPPPSNQSPAASQPESPPRTSVAEETRQTASPRQNDVEPGADADTVRTQNCEQARLNLEILETSQNPVLVDAEGNETLLDDEQKQAAMARNREYIETHCIP